MPSADKDLRRQQQRDRREQLREKGVKAKPRGVRPERERKRALRQALAECVAVEPAALALGDMPSLGRDGRSGRQHGYPHRVERPRQCG
eukprot:6659482-Prymnesium_polylepis.2